MKAYSYLAFAAAIATYVLIVVGGVVRVTGSGLGCPDWPLCEGSAIPPPRIDAYIEFSHRASAVATSILIVASLLFAWFPIRRPAAPWMTAASVTLVFQILLGAVTVLSELLPHVVNIHLAVALIVFALVLVGAVVSLPPSVLNRQVSRKVSRNAVLSTLLVFVVIITGTYVWGSGSSLACPSWPFCADPMLPSRGPDAINFLHRVVVLLVGGHLAMTGLAAWRERPAAPAVAWVGLTSVALFLTQSLVGAAVVLTRLGGPWPGLHLALAALTWASLVVLVALTRPAPTRLNETEGSAGSVQSGGVASAGETVRTYLALTKPVIVLLLMTTTVAAMFVALGALPPLSVLVATIIGGYCAAGGANAINCYIDRDIDPLMTRTQRRPHVSGKIPPAHSLYFGIALAVVSFVVLAVFVNALTAFMALLGLISYVFLYTLFLKRSTTHNIVIGGIAGSIPPMVGWAAATGRLDLPAFYLFAIIFYWTPPHFWALALLMKSEYEKVHIPMLPVVRGDDETRRQILLYSMLMLPVTLLLFGGNILGVVYFTIASVLGIIFVWYAYRLYRDKTTKSASALFHYSNSYLALIFLAMVIDRFLRV